MPLKKPLPLFLLYTFISTFTYASPPIPMTPLYQTDATVLDVAFSEDGRRIAYGTSDKIVIKELERDTILFIVDTPKNYTTMRFSPNGRYISYKNGQAITIWNLERQKIQVQFQAFDKELKDMLFSPDNRLLCAIGKDSEVKPNGDTLDKPLIKFWDVERGGKISAFNPHTKAIKAVAFNPNSQEIASCGDDETNIKLSEINNGKKRKEWSLTTDKDPIYPTALAYSRDGQLLAVGANNATAWIYNLRENNRLKSRLKGSPLPIQDDENAIRSIVFSPNNQLIFGANSRIFVWSNQTDKNLATLADPYGPNTLYSNPYKPILIAGSATATFKGIKSWNLDSLNPKKALYTQLRQEMDLWNKAEPFETKTTYLSRINMSSDYVSDALKKALNLLDPILGIDREIRVQNNDTELSIKAPGLQPFTVKIPKNTLSKETTISSLQFENLSIERNERFDENTLWHVKAATLILPEQKVTLSYSENPNAPPLSTAPHWENNSFETADLVSLTEAANQGNIFAQYQLAKKQEGEGQIETAKVGYESSAEKGHPDAQHRLGKLLQHSDSEKAMSLFLRAASNSHTEAQYELGNGYIQKGTSYYNPEKALYWLTQSAGTGTATHQYELARLYEGATDIPPNLGLALYWYTKAAENKNIDAQARLGELYSGNIKMNTNKTLAEYWLKSAALQSHPKAEFSYGTLLLQRKDTQNEIDGLQWIRKAAEQNLPEAKLLLANRYLNGTGVVQNKAKAMRFLQNQATENRLILNSDIGTDILQTIKTYFNPKTNENPEAETLANRGIEGFKNGLTRIGQKQIEEAIAKDPKLFYMDDCWFLFSEATIPLQLASQYMKALYPSKKDSPDFWIDYAHLANLAGQPQLALQALKNIPPLTIHLSGDLQLLIQTLSEVLKATAYMEAGNELEALEHLYAYGKFDKDNAALIHYINNWCTPLLKNKQRLSFATSIPEKAWTGTYKPIVSQELYNLFQNTMEPAIKPVEVAPPTIPTPSTTTSTPNVTPTPLPTK
ncbi:MAG: hypothetical protein EXS67_03245 [Candidatus Margulisbacteria bacterium]|nr:hypothetical protein [Candidatus Margulisiibacteriota bacterium]